MIEETDILSWLGSLFDGYPFTFSQSIGFTGAAITTVHVEEVHFNQLLKGIENNGDEYTPDYFASFKIKDYVVDIGYSDRIVIFKGWFQAELGEVEDYDWMTKTSL